MRRRTEFLLYLVNIIFNTFVFEKLKIFKISIASTRIIQYLIISLEMKIRALAIKFVN